jgi:small-conductance mechanosensitive channel
MATGDTIPNPRPAGGFGSCVATVLVLALGAGAGLFAQPSQAPPVVPAGAGTTASASRSPGTPDRSTPRRTVQGFIDACRDGDYQTAARYLDLSAQPADEAQRLGPRLARRFKLVLDQTLWIDLEKVSDDPAGATDDGLPADVDRIGVIPIGAGEQSVLVRQRRSPSGEPIWLFSAATVAAISPLYEVYGIGWLGNHIPGWMFRHRVWELELWQLLGVLALLPLGYVVGHLMSRFITALARRWARRTKGRWDDEIAEVLEHPLRLVLWAGVTFVACSGLRLSQPAHDLLAILVRSACLVALGSFGFRAIRIVGRELERRLCESVDDERKRKGIATRVDVLQQIAAGGVVLLAAAMLLAQFEVVRTVGLSLLASAGLAGVVLGFAAQRSVANLFAGFQIMLTQPIGIGDVVIVEGEWGTIEEINFTHVVVKIWDLRRLVVPIAYFLERPFQNWTRVSTELLGTIYFYTDYRVDLEAMRAELDRILAATDLWDGKVKGIVVTGLKDHVVEVRALISAADSGKQWDLRCLVREKLLDWLQRQEAALPRLRLINEDPSRPLPPHR